MPAASSAGAPRVCGERDGRRRIITNCWACRAARTTRAIKAAYRKLAKECHPDRHGGCTDQEAQFKAISEAYDCLKDPQKRAAYDRFGKAAFQKAAAATRSAAAAASTASPTSSRRSSASSWTRAAQRQNAARGADLRYDLELTLEEAFAGTEATSRSKRSRGASSCERHAAAPARRELRADLRDLRRRRQGPRPAGLLRGRARLPDLPRQRRSHRRSVPRLRRRRPRAQAPQAVGEDSRRRRRRHAHPRCRRRRSRRPQRRRAATSTSSST